MPFFNSFLGHYLAQTVLYSLLVVTVVETLLLTWDVREPLAQIKFRFLALLLPLLCPILFPLLYPARNGFYFRELVALIDINTWLALGGGIAVWHFFAAMLLVTAGVFLVKEGLPTMTHRLMRPPSLPVIQKGQFPRLDAALSGLPEAAVRPPAILLSPEDVPVAYISGRHALVISATMIDLLDDDELRAFIGHEIAHLDKTVRGVSRIFLLLRWLQFYNPLAFLVFRRFIADREKLCDDIAARLSGKQLSLTSGLLKIFQIATGDGEEEGQGKRLLRRRVINLEDVANWNLVKERVRRLVQDGSAARVPYQNFRMAVTGLMLAALLFFIV